jgi:hypothetical protein
LLTEERTIADGFWATGQLLASVDSQILLTTERTLVDGFSVTGQLLASGDSVGYC